MGTAIQAIACTALLVCKYHNTHFPICMIGSCGCLPNIIRPHVFSFNIPIYMLSINIVLIITSERKKFVPNKKG